MRLTRATLAPLLFASLTFCLAARAEARQAQGASAEARRLASSADDYAATLGGRREALRRLEEAARLHSEAGEGAEAARALNRAGRLRLLLSETRASLEAHLRALSLLRRAPDAEAEADALNGLGETYVHLQQKGQAERALRRSLAVSERGGYGRGRAHALVTLSVVQIYKDQALAMATAEEALALWRSLGDPRGLALAHSQVGRCHFAQNRLAESAQNYESAVQLWRGLRDRPGEAGALIMLGFVEYRKGEWRANIERLTQAQALLDEEAEPLMMGQIAAGLAEAFNEAGLPEDGLRHFGRALEYYRRTQNPHLIWYATWGLGGTHLLLGDYPAAFDHLRRSLEGVDADGAEAAQTHHYLGRTYLAAGDTAAALRHFRTALDHYERRRNPNWAARPRGLMGQA
ncbi:MAG TPA: tetratricopeptide repeat protein, partial [Pyrinomonadaceae bacterium]